MSRLTMRQPTLTFAIHLHGRLVVLAPFPYLFGSLRQPGSAPASLVSGQDREGLYSFVLRFMCRSRCSCSRSRAHCSRSSSTETGSCCSRCYRDGSHAPAVSAAALSFQRTQPHQRRLLRFACAIWSLALDFVYCGSGTAAIHKPQQMPARVYRGNFSVPSRLTAALVLRLGAALSGRAFSSSRYRAPLFSVSIPLYDNRCRSRRTWPRARAH